MQETCHCVAPLRLFCHDLLRKSHNDNGYKFASSVIARNAKQIRDNLQSLNNQNIVLQKNIQDKIGAEFKKFNAKIEPRMPTISQVA